MQGIPIFGDLTPEQVVSTRILDRNGETIFEIFADERRTPVSLDEIPDYVEQATISIEDKDFYRHHGFSVNGIARAARNTIFEQKLEGGSTLTQQLVKNSLLSPERTIRRKVQEFVLAALVELRLGKDEILERYLNEIPYGSTAYGVVAASELYFGKDVGELSLAEAAMLAGLPAAPTRFSPFGANPSLARSRQEAVLRRMVEDGAITKEEAEDALREEVVFAEVEAPTAPHFALWIKEQLAEKYGDKVVEQGGLRVTTTLDLNLQREAEVAVAEEVEELSNLNVRNGAAIVTRPATGEILAMVGSKDFFAVDEDGKVNIIFARRQPGSSIKPINYALALRDGKITASTVIADIPTCFNVLGQAQYCPANYDGSFHGATQARFALGNSYNIPAVRVLALNGLSNFVDFARTMGLESLRDPAAYGLSLTLGGGEVRPFDMATAYGTFANGGIKQTLISVLKVEDFRGMVLEEVDLEAIELSGERVITPDVSFIISHILHDNNARLAAFGPRSFLNVTGHPEVSVKTGTTNDIRDNWTVGYSKHAVVVTWVGNNDNSPMNGAVSGVSGASPIWNRIISAVLDRAKSGAFNPADEALSGWPDQPTNVVGRAVCADSGTLPGGDHADCPTRFEFFLEKFLPSEGTFRQDLQVDRELQILATADTPPERIETQNHLIVQDPLGTIVCLTCPFEMTPVAINANFAVAPAIEEENAQ